MAGSFLESFFVLLLFTIPSRLYLNYKHKNMSWLGRGGGGDCIGLFENSSVSQICRIKTWN